MNKFLLMVCLFIICCGGEPERGELLAAPEDISIREQRIVLSTTLTRIKGSDQPVFGACMVNAKDSTPLPTSMTLEAVWLVHEKEIWRPHFTEKYTQIESRRISIFKVFADGPKWEPLQYVDVVVRIGHNGHFQLLRASNQIIGVVTKVPGPLIESDSGSEEERSP